MASVIHDDLWFKEIEHKNKNFVEHYIKRGCCIDRVNSRGLTGLMLSLTKGHYEFADWLISQGANIHHPAVNKVDVLALACKYSPHIAPAPAFVERLLSLGIQVSTQTAGAYQLGKMAVRYGRVDFMQRALNEGLDPNVRVDGMMGKKGNHSGLSIFEHACLGTSVDILTFLLDRAAHIDGVNSPNEFSPLMMAVFKNRASNVELLLRAGADPTRIYWHMDDPEKTLKASDLAIKRPTLHQTLKEWEARWDAKHLEAETRAALSRSPNPRL